MGLDDFYKDASDFVSDAWDDVKEFTEDLVGGDIWDIVEDVGDFIEDYGWWWVAPVVGMYETAKDVFTPELPRSPTYNTLTGRIKNTSAEGIVLSRCYGKCKIGGNKVRYNDPDDTTDLRIICIHCQGEVNGVTTWYVNDIEWGDLTTSTHTKTEYTGTRTQTADARFPTKVSAYRGMAYTAYTFLKKKKKNDSEVGDNPNLTVIMEGLKCAPLAGGAAAFTRNPAVILYDWYINVEGYSAGDLDTTEFQSLEALCDEVPTGGTLPRYRFDFNFDTNSTINDAKKLIWQSFNGRVVRSQGKLKPVWDSGQMSDGIGGLTAKTVSHAFTEDNIIKDSLSWSQLDQPNVVRIHFIDSDDDYKKSSVDVKNEHDIETNGEILYEENAYYITNEELARRRAKFKFSKFQYPDYRAKLSAFSGAGDVELYDMVSVTHTLPGWTAKEFIVVEKSEDVYGTMTFTLEAYYSGVYDDSEIGAQPNFASNFQNPYLLPAPIWEDNVFLNLAFTVGGNLLMNAGFEEGSDCWETGSGFSFETTGGDDSNSHLKITRSGANLFCYQTNLDGTDRYYEVTEGAVYGYGGSVKSSNGTCVARIILMVYDKDKASITSTGAESVATSWTSIADEYTIPSGGKFVRFRCNAYTADGDASFDNLFFRQVDLPSIDYIGEGTTYGKVLQTSISAGKIVLSETTGDLDDIDNGTYYGKILKTGISAGQINLTSGVTGVLPVANSEADVTADNTAANAANYTGTSISVTYTDADVTADNPQNLGWIIASTGTLEITSTGKLKLSTSDALEVATAEGIKVTAGADIRMVGSDSNPGLFFFEGTSYDVKIGGNASGTEFDIVPITNNVTNLNISEGAILGTTGYFKQININAKFKSVISGRYDAGTQGWFIGKSESTYSEAILGAAYSYTENTVRVKHSSTEDDFYPSPTGTINLGNSTYYWNDVSYKTLSDRGCLGWFDNGVEMPDGSIVSDLEALKAIEKDTRPGKNTVYGVPMLDYRTMPKAVYKPAGNKLEVYPRDANDEPYTFDEDGKKIPAADGAEVTALLSIMIGAIKELDSKITAMEAIQ